MHLDAFRDHALGLPGATEDLPFGPDTLVFRVSGKIFALLWLDATEPTANLKCDPERAIDLCETYTGVRPGYHMNKRHWTAQRRRSPHGRASGRRPGRAPARPDRARLRARPRRPSESGSPEPPADRGALRVTRRSHSPGPGVRHRHTPSSR